MMLTTDLALKFDPIYRKIAKRFLENPEEFEEAFAKAWYKLTHRDLGPRVRYIEKEPVEEIFPWQDPLPERKWEVINGEDIETLKEEILNSGLSIRDLVYTAWSSASTYRDSDKRGGTNGARIALEPQINWEVNEPENLKRVIDVLNKIKSKFNGKNERKVSLADLIVLGGCAGVEKAIKNAGYDIKVPFTPGRVDAPQEYVDMEAYINLEPKVDGFRNYLKEKSSLFLPEELLIDKAQLLRLSAPELVVLIGGLRMLRCNYKNTDYGVLTEKPETLTNDYFVNLLDMNIRWERADNEDFLFKGIDRNTGEEKWKATRFDLIIAADSELRAITEVYAFDNSTEKFIQDFVKAWDKVMNLDRFDLN
jgi:catalase-peroxidase